MESGRLREVVVRGGSRFQCAYLCEFIKCE